MDPVADSQLESSLRELLANRRPREGAPTALRTHAAQLTEIGGRRHFGGAGSLAGAAVSVAIMAACVLVVSLATAPGVMGPAATPGPIEPVPTFDIEAIGHGIVPGADDLRGGAAKVLYVAAIVLAFVAITRWRRFRLAVALTAAVGVAGAAWALDVFPGPTGGNAWGYPRPAEIREPPELSDGRTVAILRGAPNEPFWMVATVKNAGWLPVTITGLIEDPADRDVRSGPHWAAVWLAPGSQHGIPAIEQTQPFRPFVLQPGEIAPLYVVGRSGRCIAQPTGSWSAAITRSQLQVRYVVLGLESSARFDLDFIVGEYQREDCS